MISRNGRSTFILLADIAFIVMGVIGAYRVALRPGLPGTYAHETSKVIIGGVKDAAVGDGLRPGDTILSINGQPVSSQDEIEFLTDHMRIGQKASLLVERGGARLSVVAVLDKFYSLRYQVIQVLVGGLYFFLAILVLFKKSGDRAAQVFHWLAVTIGGMVMYTWASYSFRPYGLGHAVQVLDLAANAFVPVLFLQFSFIFPRDKLRMIEKLLPWVWAAAALWFAWMMITFLQAAFPPNTAAHQRFMTAYSSQRWFFSLCLVVGLGSFVHTYATTRDAIERRQIRWILLGLIVSALGFTVLWRIPYLIYQRPLISAEVVVLLSAAAPIAFAISIVRHQLMDIDFILNRGTVYFIVIGALLAIYAVIIGTVAVIIDQLTIEVSLISSALAATVVAVLFEPTRRGIQQFVDRTFFRIKYNYREAQRRLTDDIAHCVDEKTLSELVVDSLDQLLMPEGIGLIMKEVAERSLVLVSHQGAPTFQEQNTLDYLKENPYAEPLPLAVDDKIEPGAVHKSANADLFRDLGVALISVIVTEAREILGYLIIGPKKSGSRFYVEDVDLINSVANQAGLAVERIMLNRKLVLEHAETVRLKELNQLKSFFVSSVSHELKTPLTSITLFAELLRSKQNIDSAEVSEYLDIIVGESQRLSARIENVLDFARIERGVKEYDYQKVHLNELVKKVIESLKYQIEMQQFQVSLNLMTDEVSIRADFEAVSESVTNLVINAIKYSGKSKLVNVSTFCREGFACIEVEDRGMGISPEDQARIFEPFYRAGGERAQEISGTGLGLQLVKHTMDAHNGKIELQSIPGEGSTFTLMFPKGEDHEAHPDHRG